MNDDYINQAVGEKELEALRRLAKEEEIDFFRRNAHLIGVYRDRLIAVALCQGAALQCMGLGRGVKDFDVHFFYLQNPAKPRLSRTVKRISAVIGAFANIQVDFVRTIVPYDPACEQMSSVEQVRRFLASKRTRNAFHLAKQPAIGLLPDELFNVIIWRPEGSSNLRVDGSVALENQYRDMASDATHEREAEEWIEALVGDAFTEK
ncbi:MAG: hypothetical protein ABSG72_15505 [Candidatus Sulfotelmatobacter sp.]|jgi:hypothetical protein